MHASRIANSGHFIVCLLLVVLITMIRVFYLSISDYNLFFDEAQYWHWSLNPDWGYYSKPPMVAWMIAGTTSVCGHEEWCIRLSSPILHAMTSLVIFAIGIRLANRKVAFYSALVFITLPAVTLSSFLISTDPSLLFFWALCSYSFLRALESPYLRWWLLTGLFAGLGMLSKYNMLLLLCSAILFLSISKEHTHHLKSRGFWIALIVAVVVFLPNLLWNYSHDFVSFLHTKDNANLQKNWINFDHMAEFIGAQFGVFGPVLFAILLCLLWQTPKRLKEQPYNFFLAFIWPLLGLITLISFLSRAHANWAAPIYISATLLVVYWCIEHHKKRWIYLSLILHLSIMAAFVNLPSVISSLGITLTGSTNNISERTIKDPLKRLHGWKTLGNSVTQLMQYYPDAGLLTETRKIHTELLYYIQPHLANIIKWNPSGHIRDHYDLTTDINLSLTKDFIFVTENRDIHHIEPYFETIERIGHVKRTPYADDHSGDIYLFHVIGFKGYAHPSD